MSGLTKRAAANLLLTLCALVALDLILGDSGWAGSPRHHPRSIPCDECHLAGAQTTPEDAHQLLGSQEKLCGDCHQREMAISHPSGFQPNQSIPTEFPLDWKGDITCSTCHDLSKSSPRMIRGNKRGRDLCLSCHKQEFFSRMMDGGLSIQQGGHLKKSKGKLPVPLDSYSMHCLGCHENQLSSANIGDDGQIILRHAGSSLTHPVGSDYMEVYARKGDYHHPSRLSKNIMLPDGLVSCVSCHMGYSKKHGQLVTPNVRSRLCFECHNK